MDELSDHPAVFDTPMELTPVADSLVLLRLKAITLLARREHSQQELVEKLGKTGIDDAIVLEVVARLAAQGLQSDERFAAAFVRVRRQQGYGPSRILQELKTKGLDSGIIEQAVGDSAVDGYDQALAWTQRKYSTLCLKDPKMYRRAYAALARRGFGSEVVVSVLKAIKNAQ